MGTTVLFAPFVLVALFTLFPLAGGTTAADVTGAALVTAMKRRKRVAVTAVVGVLAD